jgi:hypothetical protein
MPPTIIGSPRRSMATIETRIQAIKDCYIEMKPVREVINAIYGDNKPPKNAGMVLASWRRSLNKKLEKGDKEILALCKKAGIVRGEK